MTVKYAIFDMDGTLVDSMKHWRMAEVKAVETHFNCKFTEEQFEEILPLTYFSAMSKMSEITGIDVHLKEVDDYAYKYMRDYYDGDDIKLKPYILEYLKYLKENGCGVAVATATPKEMAKAHLKKQGLLQYIDYIFTEADDSKIGKSQSSKLYDIAMEALGGTKENTAVFEDAVWCIRTSAAAGYYTVAIADEIQSQYYPEIKRLSSKFINTYKEMME